MLVEGSGTYQGSKSKGIKHRDEREKTGRRDRKTAIHIDTGERTGIGREGEINCENKLREPHSGKMGKE